MKNLDSINRRSGIFCNFHKNAIIHPFEFHWRHFTYISTFTQLLFHFVNKICVFTNEYDSTLFVYVFTKEYDSILSVYVFTNEYDSPLHT